MSTPRKPVHPDCNGNITCPVTGHVTATAFKNGRVTWRHAHLTDGQRKTLRERRMQASKDLRVHKDL